MKLLNFVILIVLVVSFIQCEREDYTLDKKKQLYIDTFSTRLIKGIGVEMDSLCDLNHESYVKDAVDSILNARKKEIEKMLRN